MPRLSQERAGAGQELFRPLNFESDEPHQFDAIALCGDTVVQLEIKGHPAIPDLVLEVYVSQVVVLSANGSEGKIVRADEAKRAACQ